MGLGAWQLKKVCILSDRLLTLFYIFTDISLCHL